MSRIIRETCPICGDASDLVDQTRTIDPDSDEVVELRECRTCRHWWHSPTPGPEELMSMYAHAAAVVVDSGAKEQYAAKTAIDPFQAAILRTTADDPPARYLEIGAGGGHLLRRLRERGNLCYGVDPGQWTADPWIFSTLDQVPSDITFDRFVLQDVVEHLPDPVALLRTLSSRAADGAKLYCSFPWNESRPARRYRGRWCMVRPFGHLQYFSVRSARDMLRRTGWSVLSVRTARVTPLFWSIRKGHMRAIAYEFLKGGRDQLYVIAAAAANGKEEQAHWSVKR